MNKGKREKIFTITKLVLLTSFEVMYIFFLYKYFQYSNDKTLILLLAIVTTLVITRMIVLELSRLKEDKNKERCKY